MVEAENICPGDVELKLRYQCSN